MELRAYLRAVRKSWWVVVLVTILGGGAAALLVSRATPVYAANLTFYVGTVPATTSSPDSVQQFAEDQAITLADVVSGDRLAALVVNTAKLPLEPKQVAKKISGSAKLNTLLVNVTVKDTSPSRALAIASAIGDDFPGYVKGLNPGSSATTVHLALTSGPNVGTSPISPRKKLDTALGIAAGLLIGLLLAVLREVFDTAVRTPEALAELTERPVLGDITFDSRARKTPLFVDEAHGVRRSEEFRHLRTNLTFLDAEEPIRVVVVTSALQAEGKSSTAANLAVVAAEADTRVLLIEADLRRSSLSDYLGIERFSGLTNVLAGRVDVDEVLQPWGENLMVLAAGPVPPNPSELLGGRRMAALIAELRGRFDLIIIDTPPLLPVTDAAVTTAHADGVLLVVRHGKTKRGQLASALDTLATANARVLGTVLSMRPSRGVDASSYTAYYRAENPAAGDDLWNAISVTTTAAAAPPAHKRSRLRFWRRRGRTGAGSPAPKKKSKSKSKGGRSKSDNGKPESISRPDDERVNATRGD